MSRRLKGVKCFKCSGEVWYLDDNNKVIIYCDNLNCPLKFIIQTKIDEDNYEKYRKIVKKSVKRGQSNG